MDPSLARILARTVQTIITGENPPQICEETGDADAGDIRFRVILPRQTCGLIRRCGDAFYSRHVVNFMGEWFVRTHLSRFTAFARSCITPLGWIVSEHKSFGMQVHPNGLVFVFNVSLLKQIADAKAATPATSAVPEPPTPFHASPAFAPPAANASEDFRTWLSGIPLQTPRQMFDRLAEEGYVGQHAARIAVCLMAYRHVRRLRMIHLDGVPRSKLPAKENCLLLGPTGCGKTHLVELLFQRILGLPTIIADMTQFTESGYVGDKVTSLLSRLIQAANGDTQRAAVGIICLDEFDKLAGCVSRARFSGQGTTKDVSGYGVQRELLKMLESSDIHDSDANRAAEAHIHTQDIPFIACGAFSGFKTTVDQRRHNPNIGFAALPGGLMGGEPICERVTEEEILPVANFAAYGMLPELMGRFSRIVPLQPMGMKELLQILSTQVIERYRKELGMAGIHLDIEPGVLERIARECLIRETGARGIASSLGNHLEQACFSVYSLADPAGSVVQVKCNGDRIDVTLETGGETQPLTGKSVATTRA